MRGLILLTLVLSVAACTAAPAQPIGLPPAPTSAPALTPTAAAIASIDLAPYRGAMKPAFAAEIDRFATVPQYQIDLTIAPDLSSYSAVQRVRYTNTETEPLKEIYFSLFANLPSYGGELTVQSVKVNGQSVTPQFDQSDVFMKIDLSEPLLPDETIEIELAYAADVPVEDAEQGYNQFGLHDGILTLPNFYPQIPVYDDEGWNITPGPGYGDAVFSDTALYQVNITAPADEVVATSGVCDRAGHETATVYHCVSGPMRDFMIAMSSDYQVKSDTIDGVKVNSYYREEFAKEGKRGLQVVSDALRAYNQRIGEYLFSELDLVATPTTAGGIEYPGLIVIAEGLSERTPVFYESATAHEVAHQWWYSLVGNDQIDEPWLDEALTQFTTALYFHDVYGTQGMRGYVDSLQGRYKRLQGTPDDKRADLPVADYDEGQYGAIVYGKAPLFFNALYEEIGDAKFNQLLQDYFTQHRYAIAYPQDFLKIAEGYVGKAKLDEMLKEWIKTP
jgi:aminopeptidase N